MGEGSFQHVGDDFHVAVRVGREASAGVDSVFVDDSQMTEAHVLWIVVVAERKRMAAVQPIGSGASPLIAASNSDHVASLSFHMNKMGNAQRHPEVAGAVLPER
jgi:hypothetical protein